MHGAGSNTTFAGVAVAVVAPFVAVGLDSCETDRVLVREDSTGSGWS